ncbi:Xaa-Pro peptidase family protein [uncultured Corynebacterium sp.]|uniref:M24 family metallopeptidase n=1 Tax=uncultured Corynebacterium sp. TaxID=159447 RepID=UPI0025DF47CA|nr:M24 family metallopeptidase [uncultured Corynebacterium sp.]
MNTPVDFSSRRMAVARTVAAAGHRNLLVSDLKNIRYLSGFTGSNAALLLGADGTGTIVTDGRYDTQVRQQTASAPGLDIRITRDLFGELTRVAGEDGYAVEPGLPVGEARALGDPEILVGAVESARLVKDASELEALREAGRLADTVFTEFLAHGGIREGITEIEAAADLEHRLRSAGADGLSFDTILASGVNGAKPHAGVSRDVIVPGLVTVDFGVWLDGYASDQTRTVCVGEPNALARELFEIVHRSFLAGVDAVAPGAGLVEIDRTCRDVIDAAGYGRYFVHSTGHGVGLDVHEAPSASVRTDPAETLAAGETLTIEPGVYLPGRTGLRIENTYIVTGDGAESVNPSTTELQVV